MLPDKYITYFRIRCHSYENLRDANKTFSKNLKKDSSLRERIPKRYETDDYFRFCWPLVSTLPTTILHFNFFTFLHSQLVE